MLQQTPKTTTTMNTYPIEYISDREFMLRFLHYPDSRTENDYNRAFNYDKSYIEYIPERFQTQEMWNLYVESYYFTITNIPKKFQTPEIWYKALKNQCCSNWLDDDPDYPRLNDEIEYIFPIELITKNTFDIVRQFIIPKEKMYYIKFFSYRIWEKRRAFCIIINQPGFETTTKLNSDVLKLVASFI
jgi:hypothetical protein